MTLMSFVNLGIAAMTGLLLNIGSVGVSTMNQTVASDEAVESKGCAANFNDELIAFHFVGDNYSESEVTDINNWALGLDPLHDCTINVDEIPCVIRVDQTYVSGGSLLNTINLTASPTIGGTYYISGSDDPLMDKFNKQL